MAAFTRGSSSLYIEALAPNYNQTRSHYRSHNRQHMLSTTSLSFLTCPSSPVGRVASDDTGRRKFPGGQQATLHYRVNGGAGDMDAVAPSDGNAARAYSTSEIIDPVSKVSFGITDDTSNPLLRVRYRPQTLAIRFRLLRNGCWLPDDRQQFGAVSDWLQRIFLDQ